MKRDLSRSSAAARVSRSHNVGWWSSISFALHTQREYRNEYHHPNAKIFYGNFMEQQRVTVMKIWNKFVIVWQTKMAQKENMVGIGLFVYFCSAWLCSAAVASASICFRFIWSDLIFPFMGKVCQTEDYYMHNL